MIVKEAQLLRALDAPTRDWRLILLHGPDEGGIRTLVERFAATMGADAERVDIDASALKNDPRPLRDEANAYTMFGGPRWIRVTGGDDATAAVEALMEGPAGCPVIVAAGALKPASALLKLAAAHPAILALTCYRPDGERAEAVVMQIGRTVGVRLSMDAARLVADATAGDRALMLRELEKLALYVDAAPDRPRAVERDDVDAAGAAIDLREPATLIDAIFDGRPHGLADELTGEAAAEPIPSLRAIQRRALAIGRALAARRGGSGPRLFNAREKEAVERQARHWSPSAAATAHRRAMDAEAMVKQPGGAGDAVAHQAMLALARAAERRR